MGTDMEKMRNQLYKMTGVIEDLLPGVGYGFFLFDLQNLTEASYVSNTDNASMIRILKHIIDRLEKAEPHIAGKGVAAGTLTTFEDVVMGMRDILSNTPEEKK